MKFVKWAQENLVVYHNGSPVFLDFSDSPNPPLLNKIARNTEGKRTVSSFAIMLISKSQVIGVFRDRGEDRGRNSLNKKCMNSKNCLRFCFFETTAEPDIPPYIAVHSMVIPLETYAHDCSETIHFI
jgi:hypothetical protein